MREGGKDISVRLTEIEKENGKLRIRERMKQRERVRYL